MGHTEKQEPIHLFDVNKDIIPFRDSLMSGWSKEMKEEWFAAIKKRFNALNNEIQK